MKKALALFLALMLACTVSFACFAEAAEVQEAQYTSFTEHLQAFLAGINLQEKDLYLAEQNGENTAQLLVGLSDDGTINLMAGQNDQVIGTLQFNNEAAYLSYQGSVMGIKLETIQNFISALPQKLLGLLKNLGLDPEQLTADFQTLAGLGQKLITKIMPAIQQSVDGDVITITLDSESYAQLYAEAIDELIADASFQEIVGRYAPVFGAQVDLEQLPAGWQSIREQVVAVMKTLEIKLTINQSSGAFTFEMGLTPDEASKLACTGSGLMSAKGTDINMEMTMISNDQDIRVGVTQHMEMGGFTQVPTKLTQHEVVTVNGQSMTMDMDYEANMLGMPESVLVTMAQEGQEMMRIQYADSTFTVNMQGQEMLFVQYKDNVLTARVNGMEIVARETENDADHMTYEIAVTANGTTQTVNVIYSILDNEGEEYLDIKAVQGEQTLMTCQLLKAEKQAFPLLKDDANLNMITEEQLDSLFNSLVAQLMGSLSNQ